LLFTAALGAAEPNLLKNPGFEEAASGADPVPDWATSPDSAGKAVLTEKETHAGLHAVAIPANTAVEQKTAMLEPGAYVARCWVKSESGQRITFLLQDTDRPWAAYNCAEIQATPAQWTRLETFCALDRSGALTLTLGGMSKDFRDYHGTAGEMKTPIIADDFELFRYEPKLPPGQVALAAWDSKNEPPAEFGWPLRDQWSPVDSPAQPFRGTPVVEGREGWSSTRRNQADSSADASSFRHRPCHRPNAL
jgi:hypothetical protein